MIDQLLEGNRQFIANEFRPNEEYSLSIATKQTPKVLWTGCSDPRVSEHQMTGSKPGTMFMHRTSPASSPSATSTSPRSWSKASCT
jgi:carbonic anhydrase